MGERAVITLVLDERGWGAELVDTSDGSTRTSEARRTAYDALAAVGPELCVRPPIARWVCDGCGERCAGGTVVNGAPVAGAFLCDACMGESDGA